MRAGSSGTIATWGTVHPCASRRPRRAGPLVSSRSPLADRSETVSTAALTAVPSPSGATPSRPSPGPDRTGAHRDCLLSPGGGLQAALRLQPGFELVHEPLPQAFAAAARIDGQVIDDRPAAVEAAHNGADQGAILFGHQEEIRIARQLLLDFSRLVGTPEVNPGPRCRP